MQKIRINADDLGRTKVVDDAIEKCMSEGTINSTTIMANGEDFDNVKAITERHPEISYGVHLVIDEMECLTKPQIFVERGIMDKNGNFIKSGIRKAQIDDKVREAVYTEWCAQIDKILSAGIMIDHIDSHHHFHTMPELFSVLLRISRKYNIKKVRNSTHTTRHLHIKPVAVVHSANSGNPKFIVTRHSLINRLVSILKDYIEYYKLRHYFETSDIFCSVSTYLANKDKIDLYSGFKSIELMCHPGHSDYEKETEMLNTIRL